MAKSALGKGLSALISTRPPSLRLEVEPGENVQQVSPVVVATTPALRGTRKGSTRLKRARATVAGRGDNLASQRDRARAGAPGRTPARHDPPATETADR